MAAPLAHDVAVRAFADQLHAGGVRHVVICPGSRSTPLTLAFTRPGSPIQPWLHLDERSAAYFALGLARQTGMPVGVVCTSGTAAANFFPATVEARLSRVPLLLLTGDRPPELRDIGAPQTIDQVRMFGSHAKWAVDLPVADGTAGLERAAAAVAARAVAIALEAPAGPVHVNFPFREPLASAVEAPPSAILPIEAPRAEVARPSDADLDRLAGRLGGRRGAIVCGPEQPALPAEAIVRLADALDWPVLADPLSGLRAGTHDLARVVETYDALVREPAFTAAAEPDVVLGFGAAPTSKPLNQWLASLAANGALEVVQVDPAGAASGGWRDPDAIATSLVQADPATLCEALVPHLGDAGAPGGWAATWRAANLAARRALREAVEGFDEPFEGRAPVELAAALPSGATLVVGNSMPVRDVDSFLPALDRDVRILGTRGASGIDGVVSTAVGAAAAGDGPVVLLIGDLSLFHDLNGLWPVRRYGLSLTVLLVNNDGGGIFHFLPQTEAVPGRFEEWFGTPHGLDLRPAIEMHGGRHALLPDAGGWRETIEAALARPGLDVLELRTERERNVTLHRQAWAHVAEAVRGALAEAGQPAATGGD